MLDTILNLQIQILMLDSNTWNHLPVCKQMSFGLFKNVTYKLVIYKSHIYIHTYIYESKYGLKSDGMKVAEKQIANTILHDINMDDSKLYIWKLTCHCVFLNKREVLSRFFGKFNIFKYVSTCQIRSYDFWIMNTMCMFMYLFVVYFSFAPVISASIHRYVNYFDIQVLMMVTETLTSTLHHNIFTDLDYVFSATFIYIYIYIYNLKTIHLKLIYV